MLTMIGVACLGIRSIYDITLFAIEPKNDTNDPFECQKDFYSNTFDHYTISVISELIPTLCLFYSFQILLKKLNPSSQSLTGSMMSISEHTTTLLNTGKVNPDSPEFTLSRNI